MDKAQAVHSFWSGFGLPAYADGSVPDDAAYPYITYDVVTDSLDNIARLNASLWYRSTSWEAISKKSDEISEFLGIGGKIVKLDRGYAWFLRGTPFAQRITDEEDPFVKRIYFNLNCEYLTDK